MNKEPKVGDEIYVPTRCSISHGGDDSRGGKGRISKVSEGISAGEPCWFVTVEEVPVRSFNYKLLLQDQEKLAAQFGDERARMDPDYTDYGEDSRW